MHVVFGECEFDSGRRVLLRHGRSTALSLKAFELLEYLLARRPEAIAKTELVERLWPDTFVSDASLHNLVAEVRAALGDTPRAPRFIRTIPRYGYAFHGDAMPAPAAIDIYRGSSTAWRLVSGRREWPLSEGSNVVGRDLDCGVRIDSATLSRRHAQIVVTSTEATVEDLGSKNGTFVADRRLDSPTRLVDGDVLRVGSVQLTFSAVRTWGSTRTEPHGGG
jgi:DNA-binding winged helix-turn-helix (wHTH) protein